MSTGASWRHDPAIREMFAFDPPPYLRYGGILMRGADAVKASFDGEFRGAVFLVATEDRVDGEVVYARIDPKHVKPAGLTVSEIVTDEYAGD